MFDHLSLTDLATTLSQAMGWYLLYRKEKYLNIKKRIERTAKELEQKNNELIALGDEKKKDRNQKAATRLDKELKGIVAEYYAMKMFPTLVAGALTFGLMLAVNRNYKGIVIVRLPFEPFTFIRRITHRNLDGEDFTEGSVALVFSLCALGLRANISKLLGFGEMKGLDNQQNPFGNLGEQFDEERKKNQ
ncbi:unnamed protein product [Choristocarpus tenellus]